MIYIYFFQKVLKCQMGRLSANLSDILNSIDLSFWAKEQKVFCEIELRKKEAFNTLNSMPNNKSLRERWIKSRVLWCIWEHGKKISFQNHFSSSNLQRVFYIAKTICNKMPLKKDMNKALMKNWTQFFC